MDKVLSKRDELEAYFKRYPDVPKEVIIKEDILRFGVAFVREALDVAKNYRTKEYAGAIFSWDFVKGDEVDKTIFLQVPERLDLTGGRYGLRGRVRVLTRLNLDSPYVVDVVDGRCKVCVREGEKLIPIVDLHPFRPRPKYWDKHFEDGTPYRELSKAEAHPIVFKMCQHWGPKEECKFCDINENWRMAHKRGQAKMKKPYSDHQQVAEVIAEIFREEREPLDRPVGVFIDGGTVLEKVGGFEEEDFSLRYVEAIREKIGVRWPIHIALHPKPKQVAKEMYERGLTGVSNNFEIWDKRLFGIICPGKQRVVGWDNWMKMMIDEVDVFGEGNVVGGFVAGVEMAQPWGFKDVDEAVKSTTEGMEYLMSHGVVPRPLNWGIEGHSALAGHGPIPLDYFVRIDMNWYELMCKYRLPPPCEAIWPKRMGPGVWEFPLSAMGDMGG